MPAAADANALGRYLRVRRALVRPDAARVPGPGNRRVPGLRREEVAFLAGVSSDYYVRLEQGRDREQARRGADRPGYHRGRLGRAGPAIWPG